MAIEEWQSFIIFLLIAILVIIIVALIVAYYRAPQTTVPLNPEMQIGDTWNQTDNGHFYIYNPDTNKLINITRGGKFVVQEALPGTDTIQILIMDTVLPDGRLFRDVAYFDRSRAFLRLDDSEEGIDFDRSFDVSKDNSTLVLKIVGNNAGVQNVSAAVFQKIA